LASDGALNIASGWGLRLFEIEGVGDSHLELFQRFGRNRSMPTQTKKKRPPTKLKAVGGVLSAHPPFSPFVPYVPIPGENVGANDMRSRFDSRRRLYYVGNANGEVLGEIVAHSRLSALKEGKRKWPKEKKLEFYPKARFQDDRRLELKQLMRNLKANRTFIACHEAGHAVMAHVNGVQVTGISLQPRPFEFHGKINLCGSDVGGMKFAGFKLTNFNRVNVLIMMDLAGYLAEEIICPGVSSCRADADFARASHFAQFSLPKGVSVDDHLNSLVARARRILLRRWPAVVRVAKVLMKKMFISGDEFLELVQTRAGPLG
jgi:hypothetical protein